MTVIRMENKQKKVISNNKISNKKENQLKVFFFLRLLILFQWNESGAGGGAQAWSSVTSWFVRDCVLASERA